MKHFASGMSTDKKVWGPSAGSEQDQVDAAEMGGVWADEKHEDAKTSAFP